MKVVNGKAKSLDRSIRLLVETIFLARLCLESEASLIFLSSRSSSVVAFKNSRGGKNPNVEHSGSGGGS